MRQIDNSMGGLRAQALARLDRMQGEEEAKMNARGAGAGDINAMRMRQGNDRYIESFSPWAWWMQALTNASGDRPIGKFVGGPSAPNSNELRGVSAMRALPPSIADNPRSSFNRNPTGAFESLEAPYGSLDPGWSSLERNMSFGQPVRRR